LEKETHERARGKHTLQRPKFVLVFGGVDDVIAAHVWYKRPSHISKRDLPTQQKRPDNMKKKRTNIKKKRTNMRKETY